MSRPMIAVSVVGCVTFAFELISLFVRFILPGLLR